MSAKPPAPLLSCDQAMAALALGKPGRHSTAATAAAARTDSAAAELHIASCAPCQTERERALGVAHLLAQYPDPLPPPNHAARILAAAAPLLAWRAAQARALRQQVIWALTLALLPLPAIVFANVKLLQAAHAWLLGLLSPTLSLYLVGSLGAGIALLLALSYAAVPLLAARRARLPALMEESDVHVPA